MIHSFFRVVLCAALFTSICLFSAFAAETGDSITAERAREIALAQTGGGTVVDMGMHRRADGEQYYRFEIVGDKAAYHVEVDGRDGSLAQLLRKGRVAKEETVAEVSGTALTYEQALAEALRKTGGGLVVDSEVEMKKHGRVVYEFEIRNNGVKYHIAIDAGTGGVLKFKHKGRALPPVVASEAASASVPGNRMPGARLDAATAQAAGLERAGGGMVTQYKLDIDDGRLVHEMKIANAGARYEVEIDDATGAIVEFSLDD